jgi:Holliday junction resolvase RusA-like endonuclease
VKVFEIEIPGKPQSVDEIEFNYKTKAVYRSSKYKKYKDNISFICHEALDQRSLPIPFFLMDEPLLLNVEFVFQFNQEHHVGNKRDNPLKEPSPHWYDRKIDIDNMLKPLKDGMTGLVYPDDSQICRYGIVDKIWGYAPSINIRIYPLEYT